MHSNVALISILEETPLSMQLLHYSGAHGVKIPSGETNRKRYVQYPRVSRLILSLGHCYCFSCFGRFSPGFLPKTGLWVDWLC